MFYLKYRPRTINELDNSRVTQTLTALLKSSNLPHALLFVGQKGTGKTSTARIVAKSINCLKKTNDSIEPCNNCANCKSIDDSSSPDVIEMDAASNRGIDDIKRLIKESSFMPMVMKYRVFIIDEAHMITTDAFNALLKTLEEPPKDVIFIMATTNQEKLPKTIISRCTIVNFGRAGRMDIIHMLKRVAAAEKIQCDEKVYELIATHAENSFRDASKLLEELVIQKKFTITEAETQLGTATYNLISLLEKNSVSETLAKTQEFVNSGGSVKTVIETSLTELHDLFLESHHVPTEADRKTTLSQIQIIKLMKLLSEAYTMLKTSPIESIPLEIAIVEFYNHTNKN